MSLKTLQVDRSVRIVALFLLIASCSGGSGGSGGGGGGGVGGGSGGGGLDGAGSSSGVQSGVALYLTDAVSDYQQVSITITKVQLVNSGTRDICVVLDKTLTNDLAHLGTILQLTSIADCVAIPYNRIDVEFLKETQLRDASGTASTCSFTSYKDQGNQANVLTCDPVTNRCTLPIRGAVHSSSFDVQGGKHNKLALDFSLKDFTVTDFGLPTCAMTMKVAPLNASDMLKKNNPEAVNGIVSALDRTAKTFLLSQGTATFSVIYSGISGTSQPGIDSLLAQAETDGVRVMVTTDSIDLGTKVIAASSVAANIAGTVSALNTAVRTFTLTYGAPSKTLVLSYASPATVEGTIADAVRVKAKLCGFDSTPQEYLASHIEEVPAGTVDDDDDDVDD